MKKRAVDNTKGGSGMEFPKDMGKKCIGIIGGMGPLSSVKMYGDMIDYCQTKLNIRKNNEYPHILISNLPVPDLISSVARGDITKKMIIQELQRLEVAGVSIFAIACNTVHIYIEEFRKSISHEILSIVEEAVIELKNRKIKKILLLATPTTIKSGLYQTVFAIEGIHSIEPNEAELNFLSNLIPRLIGKTQTIQDLTMFKELIDKYSKKMDIEAVILACTELGFGINPKAHSIPIIDTMEILGKRILGKAQNSKVSLNLI